ncbi:unnamed protein product [Rhizoctonia solani]|uniref:Protein kinase domain-containing protein n=1 Tax=Rhizoctonia solani TaxID=456999 RepID=A0A8H3AUL0_9AGAM|nr:unnamed protein product [Rhizoctonia solani]
MGRSDRSHVSTPGPPSPGEVASIFDPGGYIPHSPLSCTGHGSNGFPWSSYHIPSPMATEPVGLLLDECPLVGKPSDSWIFSEMSMEEIVGALCEHGCTDLTDQLSLPECQDLPFKTGGPGNLYRGALCAGQQIVIKCLRPVIHQTSHGRQTLKRAGEELCVWSQCQHPNVIQLLGVAQYRKQLAVVSPWMPRGTLNRFLSLNLPSVVDRYKLCCQIAEGVAYLHEMGIVHGDIKAVSCHFLSFLNPQGNLNDVVRRPTFWSPRINGLYSPSLVVVSSRDILFNPTVLQRELIYPFVGRYVSQVCRWTCADNSTYEAPEALEGQGTPTAKGDVYALGMASLMTTLS